MASHSDKTNFSKLLNEAIDSNKNDALIAKVFIDLISELSNFSKDGIDIDSAHNIITHLYTRFAKPRETVFAYREFASFALHLSRMTKYNESIDDYPDSIDRQKDNTDSEKKIIFVIDTDAWLGHIQVLCSFIEKSDPRLRQRIEVVAFNGIQGSILYKKLKKYCVPYYLLQSKKISNKLKSLEQLIKRNTDNGWCTKLVWVAWPPLMFIGSCTKLTTRQACWAMKYPFPLGHAIDEILYPYGFDKLTEGKTYAHNAFQPIISHPFYLTKDVLATQEISEKTTERSRQAIKFIKDKQQQDKISIITSVARPEKMNNPHFLNKLKRLLLQNPFTHFVWCGREDQEESHMFQQNLEKLKLSARCFFAGWVHPWSVIEASDYFLDTYPFGSGITLAQAMRLGKTILVHQQQLPDRPEIIRLEDILIKEPNFSSIIQTSQIYPKHSVVILQNEDINCYSLNNKYTSKPQEHDGSTKDIFSPNQETHAKLIKFLTT